VLDMLEVIYVDTSAAELLHRFVKNEVLRNREVVMFGLSRQAESLFQRTGLIEDIGRDRIVQTRRQALELARLRSHHYAQPDLFT
jgi:anti-anti-sigma regulatory factor